MTNEEFEARRREVLETLTKAVQRDFEAQFKMLLADDAMIGSEQSVNGLDNFARAAKAFYCRETGSDPNKVRVEVRLEPYGYCDITIHNNSTLVGDENA